jgi:hypothetical protein
VHEELIIYIELFTKYELAKNCYLHYVFTVASKFECKKYKTKQYVNLNKI